jgi:predicted nuclease of predicted toxin-antitoxin system
MSVPIVVDMSLSPEWVDFLKQAGWSTIHWSAVGHATAKDSEIMTWAASHRHAVFTHDLDFGTTLALTHASGPSVIQVRGQRVLPEHIGSVLLAALNHYQGELASGALLVVEPAKCRVRILPF